MVASPLHRYSLTVLPPRQAHRHAALAPALCSRSLHAASLHASLGLPASALAGFVTKAFLPSPMPLLASWQRPSPGWPHGDGLPAFAVAGCGAGCRRHSIILLLASHTAAPPPSPAPLLDRHSATTSCLRRHERTPAVSASSISATTARHTPRLLRATAAIKVAPSSHCPI